MLGWHHQVVPGLQFSSAHGFEGTYLYECLRERSCALLAPEDDIDTPLASATVLTFPHPHTHQVQLSSCS